MPARQGDGVTPWRSWAASSVLCPIVFLHRRRKTVSPCNRERLQGQSGLTGKSLKTAVKILNPRGRGGTQKTSTWRLGTRGQRLSDRATHFILRFKCVQRALGQGQGVAESAPSSHTEQNAPPRWQSLFTRPPAPSTGSHLLPTLPMEDGQLLCLLLCSPLTASTAQPA